MSKYEEEFIIWGRSLEIAVIFDLCDDEKISNNQIKTYENLSANYKGYFDSIKAKIY